MKAKRTNRVVAVISMQRLGDSVFTIPAIKAVFSYYSGYKIFVFTHKGAGEIYRPFLPSGSIVEIPKELIKFNRIASAEARKILNDLKPEIIFDINATVMGVSFLVNTRAQKLIGASEVFYKKIYDKHISPRERPHLTDMYLDIVAQEIPVDEFRNFRFVKEDSPGSDRILIHPFAGWKAKEWGLLKFIKLTRSLINDGYSAVLIFEKGKLGNDQIKELEVPFIETASVGALISEIANSMLFISNDSGPLYIAGSRGKATFSIYGPTNPDYSLLPGTHHSFVRNSIGCIPKVKQYCIRNGGFTCNSYECMNSLSVENVYSQLTIFLESHP